MELFYDNYKMKITGLIFLLVIILGCSTKYEDKTEAIKIEEISHSIEERVDHTSLISDESVELYDLTVLKGRSYPTIKNDTPFTDLELEILKNSQSLELEATVDVAHYFKYFLRDRRDLIELWINNSRETIPYIKNAFKENNMPVELIYLPYLESGYNPMAYSRVGAGGIWQFMPKTARSYGLRVNWWIDERRSPQLSTPYAIKHLNHLYNRFGDWYTALASYNAGEGRVSRAMKESGITNYFQLIKTDYLPMETRKYVPQYLAIVKIMKNLEKLGFNEIDWELPDRNRTIHIKGGRDLYDLSYNSGISWREFKKLNPAYRRYVNDPSVASSIFIPKHSYTRAISYLKKTPSITDKGYGYYSIKSGDTWWELARITGKDVISLKRLNSVTANNLKIGQRILLPKIIIKKEKPKTLMASVSSSFGKKMLTHRVKNGDTISGISIKYNIKLAALYRANNLNSYSILKIGQIVKLPGYTEDVKKVTLKTHKVRYGDTLSGISYKYNIKLSRLMQLNSIKDPGNIRVGDIIKLY